MKSIAQYAMENSSVNILIITYSYESKLYLEDIILRKSNAHPFSTYISFPNGSEIYVHSINSNILNSNILNIIKKIHGESLDMVLFDTRLSEYECENIVRALPAHMFASRKGRDDFFQKIEIK